MKLRQEVIFSGKKKKADILGDYKFINLQQKTQKLQEKKEIPRLKKTRNYNFMRKKTSEISRLKSYEF